jgi:hypothetical protein
MGLHGQKSGGAGWRLAPRGLSLTFVLGAIFLVVALFPKWGVGQGCGEWVNVEVNPPNPTSNDFITLILSGAWCDTCVPKSPTVSIVGHKIHCLHDQQRPSLLRSSYPLGAPSIFGKALTWPLFGVGNPQWSAHWRA